MAVLRCRVIMAQVAASPQNSREAEAEAEAEGDAPAWFRVSVMSRVRKMEKMAPMVSPHVSGMNEVRFLDCGE